MGSFLDKIAKRLAVAKGSETLDGKTMTGEQPNKVIINPDIVRHNESFKSFLSLLTEASAKSGYSDEHATAHLWNSVVNHENTNQILSNPDPSKIHDEIEKAKKDPNHPLNVNNAPKQGFVGGKVNKEGYYKELHDAASTIHGLANRSEFSDAVKNKHKMTVAGAARGKLSNTWNKNNAKNATSKADLHLFDSKLGEDKDPNIKRISLKKGDSQLMSAQPEEFAATYDHATDQHINESNSGFTSEHKKEAMRKIKKVQEHLNAMKGANPDEQRKHRDSAQKIINDIHEKHSGLLKHVHYEATTGHGKFGHNQAGSANWLVTSTPDGPHIHNTESGNEPIEAGIPRIALPKGDGRSGNVKIDYKVLRNKKEHTSRTEIPKKEPERHHTLFWGRVNPPTAGHEQAYNVVRKVARQNGGTSSMVLSRSTDPKKNPLTPEQKEKHAKRAFSKVNTSVADPQHPTLLHQLSKLHEQGVTNLHMVAGSDRHAEYRKLINQYNGVKGNHGYYNFKKVELHSAGERDPDEEGTAGISASSQRAHATNGRQKEFSAASPSTMKPAHVKELYNDVRTGLSTPAPKKLKNVVKTKIAKAS